MDSDQKDATPLFYSISSLRPPKIPVTMNRTATMQHASRDTLGMLKAMQSSDFGSSRTDVMNIEKQRMKKELTKAHRSLESLCDRMWFKQNELYSQLCRYHKLKREAVRRVYQLRQEELRFTRRQTLARNQIPPFQAFDNYETGEENNDRNRVCFVSADDTPLAGATEDNQGDAKDEQERPSIANASAHLQTILRPKDMESMRQHTSPALLDKDLLAEEAARQATRVSLPPIVEARDELARPLTTSTRTTFKDAEEADPLCNVAALLTRKRQQEAYERKVLEEPFTMYRVDKNGNFVPRDTMPLPFNIQMPTNKSTYKQRKLLEREKVTYKNCLRRGQTFNPEVHSIELKHMNNRASESPDENSRRGSNFDFVSWVPM